MSLFDPNNPRMAGKHYLTDDDPQLQRSREAYLTWKALANPRSGDLIPDEARHSAQDAARLGIPPFVITQDLAELDDREYPDPRELLEYWGADDDDEGEEEID